MHNLEKKNYSEEEHLSLNLGVEVKKKKERKRKHIKATMLCERKPASSPDAERGEKQ